MRILFVADTPFAPNNVGDAARIARLVELFGRYGWSVDFAYFEDPARTADYAAMDQACDLVEVYRATPQEHARRHGERLDDWCAPGFTDLVTRLSVERRPDVVWAHFVYHSRVFLQLPTHGRPVTVIDADNVFANRREGIERADIAYDWFSTTSDEELAGLRRADLVVAIHEGEAAHYRALDPGLDVLVVPYAPTLRFPPLADTKTLAFVGANNAENRRGIVDFVRDAWPLIRAAHPDATLRIVGGVGEVLDPGGGIALAGIVDDLAAVWAGAAVGLNTTPVGTGLKIKSVDALAHGRPLVCTTAGAHGLGSFGDGILIADCAEGFARAINSLFADPALLALMTESVRRTATALLSVQATFEPVERRLRQMLAAK